MNHTCSTCGWSYGIPMFPTCTDHTHLLWTINGKVDLLMTQQDDINADVTTLGTAVTNIENEIATLKATNPQLDLSALDAAVAQVSAIAPPAETTPPTAA